MDRLSIGYSNNKESRRQPVDITTLHTHTHTAVYETVKVKQSSTEVSKSNRFTRKINGKTAQPHTQR